MTRPIRVAVVGVGYLGRFHAQKYAMLPQCELVGVVDQDPHRARQVAQEIGVRAYPDLEALLPQVDALSIAATTTAHYSLGRQCLQAGKHLLMEKPLAATVPQAEELVSLAADKGVLLQVGYLERFNPAFLACRPLIGQPQFVEAIRISAFGPRGADVDVVLDLMSHDLDLVLSLVASPLHQLHAVGISLRTESTDLANVRLMFQNGCVASLTASRISQKAERKMRLFQRGRYFSMDLAAPAARVYSTAPTPEGSSPMMEESLEVSKSDALLAEITSFLQAVATGARPVVSGEDGLQAMSVAEQVIRDISRNVLP